ncbi:MAG: aminotransferase class IV [Bacteriovorax sp.]|jgi:branched-subunit amino acid aminotransferase/4-amino-4-deoxychorismate lyase
MKILSNELAQHYQVASLQRGYLVFTSFISKHGRILFLDEHLERLLTGADFLFPEANWTLNHEKLKQYVENEFKYCSSKIQESGYFRLTIFDDNVHFQHHELLNSPGSLGVTTAIKLKTPGLLPPFVKLSNYVESDLELVRARFKNFEDVIFFDHLHNITEASTSNLFIVVPDGNILTPAPSSMILDGILRKKLLQNLKMNGFKIREASVSKTDLLNAKEIWLTNSVKGMRFADCFDEQYFERKNSLFEKAIESFGRFGELA